MYENCPNIGQASQLLGGIIFQQVTMSALPAWPEQTQ
jgi:hypothetical protein